MKVRMILPSLLLFACIAPAFASDAARAPGVDKLPPLPCIPALQNCGTHKRIISFPAHALSFSDSPSFALHPRGVEWLNGIGTMTLTVHRPDDYAGGDIKLKIVYQVIDDAYGTLEFTVTPLAFDSGTSFETYGGLGSGDLDISETQTMLFDQSVTIPPGNGWVPSNDWWYLELHRQGSYVNTVRIMSVALEYRAK